MARSFWLRTIGVPHPPQYLREFSHLCSWSPKGFYGLIAGFCEIGETFEENVQREAMEEVGIKVKNVTYYKNQPWGISDSHMIGFFAELDGDDETLVLQEEEIADARWFTPEEVRRPANNFSLFSDLVWKFLQDHGIKK